MLNSIMVYRKISIKILFLFLILLGSFISIFAEAQNHFNDSSFVVRKKNYVYDIAACAIFQNEAPYLKEWIEYHKLVGVQHFYLYNNLSTDDYQSVLAPYILNGEVDLIEWPHKSTNVAHWTQIQTEAYENALSLALLRARWLAILDTDEFIVPVQTNSLVEALKEFDGYGGVAVNWQMYGTSCVERIPENKLMIEMLLLKAPENYSENVFVKSIVRPAAVASIEDPHRVNYKNGFYQVNSNKKQFSSSQSPSILTDKIRINHYWCKDEWFFWNRKCARRQNWQEGLDGQLQRRDNLNQVEDSIMLRFVPELKKRMGF